MKKKLALILLFLSTSLCLIYGFQKQEQMIQPEKHEVEVRLILVDVIVTKDGKFVKDLTKDDFELYEDGKRVPINSFELLSFEERELKIIEEKAEIKRPAPPKRKLTVIFDAINSWRRDIKLESKKIIDELFSLIKLGHEVMILQLHRRKGLEIIQPFTADESLIRKAVEKASGNIWKLGMDVAEVPPKFAADPERYSKLTRLEYLYLERRRFQDTIGGLLAAFNMIRNLPGRKSILLISGGIPDLSPPDMLRYPLDKIENVRLFDPFNILDKKNFKEGEEVIRELISFANAQNISIYTLDSDIYVKHLFSGSTAERYQKYEIAPFTVREGDKIRKVQNLSWISKETGASHLRGADKFDNFRQVMSTDLKYYYQLSYYPRRREADDKYHKIKVKVKRRGAKARFRKGYTDYSREEANKMQLITAFYNPALCKQLPFEGEFIPFFTKSGKYEPWMNIALPSKELFRDRFVEYTRKKFNLHIWIVDKKTGEKGFGGQINLPFNINSSFMEFIKNIDYLSFHFKGPELTFKHNEYQAVFALVDPETNEIGAWEAVVNLPDLKNSNSGTFINCILGYIKTNPEKRTESFTLSRDDGSLEYGSIKFFPKVINAFEQRSGAHVFMQVCLPTGRKNISPDFMIQGAENKIQVIGKELMAKSFNKGSRVWSGLFFLDLSPASIGENTLYVEIPGAEKGSIMSRELKLTVIRGTGEDENNKFKSSFGAKADENGNNSHNHEIFSERVSDTKSKKQSELEEILRKCAEYCEKLKSSALHFVCEEKIKEVIILKPRTEFSRLKVPAVTERNEYVYDYQLIKKGEDVKESRTLIEENKEKRNVKDAPLKTKRFYSLKSVLGPVGFLSKEFQELYNYQLKKEGKIKGRKAYIIEVIPKRKMEDKPNYGKLWVDKENFSVLKTEISQESLAGYEDLEKKTKSLSIRPILKTTHYYEVEKKGIRFPSKTVFEEVYISAAKRRERSRTVIEYDNYRFFIVDYEVKYKGGANENR